MFSRTAPAPRRRGRALRRMCRWPWLRHSSWPPVLQLVAFTEVPTLQFTGYVPSAPPACLIVTQHNARAARSNYILDRRRRPTECIAPGRPIVPATWRLAYRSREPHRGPSQSCTESSPAPDCAFTRSCTQEPGCRVELSLPEAAARGATAGGRSEDDTAYYASTSRRGKGQAAEPVRVTLTRTSAAFIVDQYTPPAGLPPSTSAQGRQVTSTSASPRNMNLPALSRPSRQGEAAKGGRGTSADNSKEQTTDAVSWGVCRTYV